MVHILMVKSLLCLEKNSYYCQNVYYSRFILSWNCVKLIMKNRAPNVEFNGLSLMGSVQLSSVVLLLSPFKCSDS